MMEQFDNFKDYKIKVYNCRKNISTLKTEIWIESEKRFSAAGGYFHFLQNWFGSNKSRLRFLEYSIL